ncbi:prepilin-type N-terminal cleavage/methylation domain-containing protein [Mollicutes bacterium LVI A0039]|nr:prepilin-type N-terminal cleavage/methylation domain-containing protein [Mollicutes bacterium LVI A0039]
MNCVLKYSQGYILIEMLVAISIIGVIMLMMANLMNMVSTNIKEDQIIIKQQQISSLISDDILDATQIELVDQCLKITTNNDIVEYCISEKKLVRTVNNHGYERLISNFEGRFTYDQTINLEINFDNKKFILPIW